MQASVVDVQTGQEETTNEFRFTWARDDGKSILRIVIPRTYEGKVHFYPFGGFHN